MFDYIEFTECKGEREAPSLVLFTLSTCSFCAEAREFLIDHDLSFRWVVTDELPFTQRRRLRNDFIRTFKERMYYPTLVVDQRQILSGFEVEEWREALGIENV